MLLLLTLLSSAAWLYLLLAHGQFWRAGPVLPEPLPPQEPAHVAVVIPARDEAEHIGATLHSLLRQRQPGTLRVVLVDDNSTDGTGELATRIAEEDPRLRVVAGEPLPAGWTGKMWAVAQGLRQPEVLAADFVLLTDADILHGEGHLRALVAHARRESCGLVSEMVRLRCETLAERATIPAFVFFFQMLYPFRSVADPGSRVAAAAGGTMLLSAEALRAVEGVSRIRAELIDDVALAREVQRAGFRLWLGHGQDVWSERRYPGFGDVWEMVARTAYVQLGYSPWMLLGTVTGMVLLYGVPVAATLAGTGLARVLGVGCWLLLAGAFGPTLERYGRSRFWGFALPAIGAFYLGATVASAARFHTGRGGRWKSRSYPAGT